MLKVVLSSCLFLSCLGGPKCRREIREVIRRPFAVCLPDPILHTVDNLNGLFRFDPTCWAPSQGVPGAF